MIRKHLTALSFAVIAAFSALNAQASTPEDNDTESAETPEEQCFYLDDDLSVYNQKTIDLATEVFSFAKLSPIANAAFLSVYENEVPVCLVEKDHDVAGTYSSKDDKIFIYGKNNVLVEGTVSTVLHEAYHALQDVRGDLSFFEESGSIEDIQKHILVVEAAARTVTTAGVYEAYVNGDSDMWGVFQYGDDVKVFEETYDEYREKGGSHNDALEYAGSQAFMAAFNNQNWLDAYNKKVIFHVADSLSKGGLGELMLAKSDTSASSINLDSQNITLKVDDAMPHASNALEDLQTAGYIHEGLNLTRFVSSVPIYDDLFGENETYKNIMDYLILEQKTITHGKQSQVYLDALTDLQKQSNPYLGFDITTFNADTDDLFEMLDEYATQSKSPESKVTTDMVFKM